jgi:hypothetical protein
VEEWHDAPIIYLSGFKKPNFTPQDIQKLRTYVLQGGTIFSCSECGGTAGFKDGIRQIYAQMFPEYELKTVTDDHPLYSNPSRLPGKPDFHLISNGVRPLVIHTDTDLPVAWQARRTETMQFAFDAANNVLAYVTKFELRNRGSWEWPEAPESEPSKKVSVVRVEYGGNWNPEPLALQRLGRLLAAQEKVGLEIGEPVELAQLGQSKAQIAFLTGTGEMKFSAQQAEALKTFVTQGGTVVIDVAGGDNEFDRAAEELIRKARFEVPPQMVTPSDDLIKLAGHNIAKSLSLRNANGSEPLNMLRKVPVFTDKGSRMAILFSRVDITGGLVGYAASKVKGFRPSTELEKDAPYLLMRNLVLQVAGE